MFFLFQLVQKVIGVRFGYPIFGVDDELRKIREDGELYEVWKLWNVSFDFWRSN